MMRKKKHTLLFIACPLFLLVQACKHEPVPGPVVVDPGPDTSLACHPDTVYFQNDILPIFLSGCAKSGCHDATTQADGIYLGTYASIMTTGEIKPGDPGNSEVYEVITENDPDKIMPPPPNAPLTQAQIGLVRTWILQGAKNNFCQETNCDSLNVTFSATIWPMIEASCKGCHGNPSPGGGIFLQNYLDVKNNATPAIWHAINHYPGSVPMPLNGSKWNQCKINQFKRWIDLGMPEN